MKIIGVMCSARPGSGSGAVVKEYLRGAEEAGHETMLVELTNGNFNGCTGCHACKKPGITRCIQKDAMAAYFDAVADADVVIFGAGNYMGWPQGQAWNFLHRHFCLSEGMGASSKSRIPVGKKLIPVFSQGVPVENMYKERYEMFLEHFKDWGFEIQEMLIACGPQAEEIKNKAYEMGKAL